MNENRIALIPIQDTNEKILPILQELKKNNFHNVVVYYGKNEEDKSFLQKLTLDAKVMILASLQGRGNAIKSGLKYIKEKYRKNTLIVTMNGDGSHTVEDAVRLCNECMIAQDIFCLGKKEELEKWEDKVNNFFTKTMYRISSGESVSNTTTTLRAFSYNFIDLLLIVKGEKEDYESNVLLSCASHKVKIREIDLTKEKENTTSYEKEKSLENGIDLLKENTKKLNASKIFFVSYMIDFVLFLFLNSIAKNHIIITNLFARLISSFFSFNKERVHKTDLEKTLKQFLMKTFALLFLETLLLLLFVKIIHLPIFMAKLFSEILYILFDYGVQEYILKEEK